VQELVEPPYLDGVGFLAGVGNSVYDQFILNYRFIVNLCPSLPLRAQSGPPIHEDPDGIVETLGEIIHDGAR